MKSLKELFRIGNGPSSSHTMGPKHAAELFLEKNLQSHSFRVTLYGSLAATGKGHLTDVAILEILAAQAPTEIQWLPKTFLPFHPNAMMFESLNEESQTTDSWTVYSVGGGALSDGEQTIGLSESDDAEVYDMNSIDEIMNWCEATGKSYWEYVEECEGIEIWDYLRNVWHVMRAAVERGLESEGVLPGPLALARKAASYNIKAKGYKTTLQSRGLVFSYALAVSEENAAGGVIVTAPTCGSCGVIPAVLYLLEETRGDRKSVV